MIVVVSKGLSEKAIDSATGHCRPFSSRASQRGGLFSVLTRSCACSCESGYLWQCALQLGFYLYLPCLLFPAVVLLANVAAQHVDLQGTYTDHNCRYGF